MASPDRAPEVTAPVMLLPDVADAPAVTTDPVMLLPDVAEAAGAEPTLVPTQVEPVLTMTLPVSVAKRIVPAGCVSPVTTVSVPVTITVLASRAAMRWRWPAEAAPMAVPKLIKGFLA